jgi:hypothetical protein
MDSSPVQEELERQSTESAKTPLGPVSRIAKKYHIESDRLLGLLLKLDFVESHLVTCDAWKRECGGGVDPVSWTL